jgi:hypothetical protein
MNTEEQPPPKSFGRKWWQFTLREWFFFIIAASAVLALISQHRPFHITPFFDSFEDQKLIRAACNRLQLNCVIRSHGGGFHLGPNTAVRRTESTFETPAPADRHRVIGELRKEIERALIHHGCNIHGRGYSGDIKKNELSEFHFDYERGNSQGDIYVESDTDGNNWWSVKIMMHEFKR